MCSRFSMPSRLCPTYEIYTRAGTGVESPSPAVSGRAPGARPTNPGTPCGSVVRGARRPAKLSPVCIIIKMKNKQLQIEMKKEASEWTDAVSEQRPHAPRDLASAHKERYTRHGSTSTRLARISDPEMHTVHRNASRPSTLPVLTSIHTTHADKSTRVSAHRDAI